MHDAAALNETRTLSFHHTHSDEDLTVTFKRDGRYDEAALKQLNHFLRDWRSQEQTTMDRHLFDILWEVYRDVDAKQPINIISAYRSPATNAMLRRRSAHTGVAQFSQHMLGHAMDFFIPGVPLEKIRFAGLRLQRGGVGFYPTSGSPFVHLDTGHVRHWPRMTHDQLVRVFPKGRTVHIPSDGNPLPGYQLAMADIEKRGQNADEDGATGSKPSNFLLALFRGKSADDDDESDGSSAAQATSETTAASATPARLGRLDPDAPAETCRSFQACVRRCPDHSGRTTFETGRSRQTADAGRYHQCPRLLGRNAGDPDAGHSAADGGRHQRPPGARRSRPATDLQHLRFIPGAGLCAGGEERRPRANCRRDRIDPAHPARRTRTQSDGRQRRDNRRRQRRTGPKRHRVNLAPTGGGGHARQRCLDARDDPFPEREPQNVGNGHRRPGHDPDAWFISSSRTRRSR